MHEKSIELLANIQSALTGQLDHVKFALSILRQDQITFTETATAAPAVKKKSHHKKVAKKAAKKAAPVLTAKGPTSKGPKEPPRVATAAIRDYIVRSLGRKPKTTRRELIEAATTKLNLGKADQHKVDLIMLDLVRYQKVIRRSAGVYEWVGAKTNGVPVSERTPVSNA